MSNRRVPLLIFVGTLLLQVAWILAVPPFRGNDEIDHAYRAAEVARGEWLPGPPAVHGRGDLVATSADLVRAARPICRSLEYMGPDNCRPVRRLADGRAVVASAAARYDPLFYWLIGTAARPVNGYHALYVMRAVAAALCAAMVALAAWAVAVWARTRWPLLALMVGLTPVVLYSLSMTAPNGLEMAAALAFWACLLGLHDARLDANTRRSLLLAAGFSGVVLVLPRSLGPLWLAAGLVTVAVTTGTGRLLTLYRRQPRAFVLPAVAVLLATVVGIAWTLLAQSNFPTPQAHPSTDTPLPSEWTQPPLWLLQSIAAFPRRSEPAAPIVYVVWGLMLTALFVVAASRAGRRHRIALLMGLAVSIAVPAALTLVTYSRLGPVWQGRYGMPYMLGVALLAGLCLDAGATRRPRVGVVAAALAAMLVGHAVSILGVFGKEQRHSPLAGTEAWITVPPWTLLALVCLALVCWTGALLLFRPARLSFSPGPNGADRGAQPLPSGPAPDSLGELRRGQT